ncbi:MAG: helix-turn-helix domain-containing protein [Oscillospiraceae bacterium]|nr:helix-turn-helix domain-containing protein [Oscillospiraceae bacterium]
MKQNFKYYIKDRDITFKYAFGPTEETNKEFHSINEIILFLEGDAELIGENIHTKILHGTLIVIPKETYHQVIIKGDAQNYHRCTLHFPDMPEFVINSKNSTGKIFLAEYNSDFIFMFEKLIKISKRPTLNANVQLRALLSLILCEMSTKCTDNCNQNTQSELLLTVMGYINQNLSRNISVQTIARANNVSVSSLAHIFKKEMNISIYQYIIKKRLILAHRKICDGELASTVAVECGFNDYSGFYKQYKKIFNCSPSGKR